MWHAVEMIGDGEGWNLIAESDDLNAAKANLPKSIAPGKAYFFFMGEIPSDPAASQKIFDDVQAQNNGRISMLTVGARIDLAEKTAASYCSGNCFCVVAHGMRRCETQYCNASGYCWWVPCGSNC